MAIKGLSKFVVAPGYEYDEATAKATYGGSAAVTEKLAKYSAETNFSESDGLYLDNGLAETAGGSFTDGTLTVGTGELTNETSKMLLTVKEVNQTVGDKTIKGLVYDNDAKGKTVGVGLIEEHQLNDVDFYRAVILPKVTFSVPGTSADTRGSSISWQTPEITGSILRCDEENEEIRNAWKYTFDCKTEAEALAAIKAWFEARKRLGSDPV